MVMERNEQEFRAQGCYICGRLAIVVIFSAKQRLRDRIECDHGTYLSLVSASMAAFILKIGQLRSGRRGGRGPGALKFRPQRRDIRSGRAS